MTRFTALVNALLFFAAFFITSTGFAQIPGGVPKPSQGNPQIGKLYGKLVDAQNKPVSYATITLMRPDGKVVNGDLTKENGTFSIEPTGLGKFKLRITILGYQEKTINDITIAGDAPEKDLGKISLKEDEHELKGAEVVGEKAVMELSVDKKVFNVEKNITSAGGSAADVLQNVPSVSVDNDGNVSLRGKTNITLLIDGKPATLLGGDAASALQSLPAGSIASVEVITNPSAKYDAQGMGGIVNIVTKRDKKFGMNGSVSVGAGSRDKYNGSFNLNMRNKKWNLFLNSNARLNHNYNYTTTDRTNRLDTLNHHYHTYEDNLRMNLGWFTTAGAEYTINDKSTIMLTENVNVMGFGGSGTTTYGIYQNFNQVDSIQRKDNSSLVNPLSISSSLDFKHKFTKAKQELTANITYARMEAHRHQDYTTSNYDGNDGLLSGPIKQSSPGSGGNSTLTGQVDFTTPMLTKNGKLETGLKAQLYDFETSNNPTITRPGQAPVTDSTLLSRYNYTQNIYAAYATWSDQKGKFGYMAGLRLEDATYEGTTNAFSGKKYSNEFLNLFPSVFISYQLPKQQSIYLNFTRRINRPGFMQLIPYIDLSNPQDTSVGNPDLKPEFINNTELNYSKQFAKGHTIIASVYYQYTENLIDRYRIFYADGTTFSQPKNLNSGVTYGLELTGRAQILPIWDATLNFNFFENDINGQNIGTGMTNSGFSWFGKANTSIKLPKSFSVQLSGNYEAPKVSLQNVQGESWWVDIGLRKNLWKNKATVVLNLSDIFNTHKYTTIYDMPQYYQSVYRDRETRVFNFTFTYRFGKTDSKSNNNRKGQQQNRDKDRNNLKVDDNDSGGF